MRLPVRRTQNMVYVLWQTAGIYSTLPSTIYARFRWVQKPTFYEFGLPRRIVRITMYRVEGLQNDVQHRFMNYEGDDGNASGIEK